MSATKYFVFLEFKNPEVNNLLRGLRRVFTGKTDNKPIHTTVKGPYAEKPTLKSLENATNNLYGQIALIADAGVFKTPKGAAVFLHVHSKVFEDIWYKPDYSSEKRIAHINQNLHAWSVCLYL
jgi:hypothetical protein